VWGCLAKVALPSHKQTTIGPKTFDVVFIDYAQNVTAYRFMLLIDYSNSEYRNVELFQHVFPLKKKVSMTSDSASKTVNLPASSSDVRVT